MKKNKKKIIIILVSIILLIGVGVTLFIIFFNHNNNNDFRIDPIDAESYYKENSNVIAITNANDSNDVITEKEAYNLLNERGFVDYQITTNYSMDGEFFEEKEIDKSASDKHPVYNTYFISEDKKVWSIDVINGRISAYPASYILESNSEKPILVVENDTIMSYDEITNKFYETIPNESEIKIIKIDRIDADTLANYQMEE